jgi:hypothetical protein
MFFGAGKQGLFDTQNDPYFNNVLLLCHFDGANGSTTITDSSLYQRTFTAYGAPTISTAQSVFGGSSLSLNGSTQALETGNGVAVPGYYAGTNADFNWGTEDFTYECWIRPTTLSGNQVFLDRWYNSIYSGTNAGGQWRGLTQSSPLGNIANGWTYSDATNGSINSGAGGVTTATWYHWAFVRYGSTWKIYINGNSVGTPITSTKAILTTTSLSGTTGVPLTIGRNQESAVWYFNGFMDELRVTRGVARYTGNFTPPTQPFPNS